MEEKHISEVFYLKIYYFKKHISTIFKYSISENILSRKKTHLGKYHISGFLKVVHLGISHLKLTHLGIAHLKLTHLGISHLKLTHLGKKTFCANFRIPK